MKNVKNKKAILISCLALAIVAIGVVFAFSHDETTLGNNFTIADYKVAYSEDFTAPQNWQPCEEVAKTFTVKNEGNAAINVRIRYEEYWRNRVDTQDLLPVKDGVTLAIINLQNETDWVLKSDGYYHYKNVLEPGATTSSLLKSVTLNCEANLDKDNICTKTANGTVCEKPADEYEGATYHLRLIAETKQVGANNFNDVMASQANPRGYVIDFTKRAVASSDVFEANGNGVNRYTENGKEIYYYRGEVNNNNVIWANLCWKILRSTAMGGTKLLYSGAPTTVDGVRQCNATGAATQIGQTTYRYANSSYSPADVGYKYGARIQVTWFNPGSTIFIYSNDVSRNGNTYTLDTSEGQSISGTWLDTRGQAAVRYHYFCTNGASTCSNTQIGYIQYYNDNWSQAGYIYYLPLNGYDNINQAMDAMYRNDTDSVAKSTIETWFRNQHLDQYEDDLEDAVYCNDRTLAHGAFIGKDANAIDDRFGDASSYNVHSEYMHTTFINEDGNLKPVLECPNTRDSFTKSEEYGNGQLNYKVGMMTSSETVLAGLSHWKSNAAADTSFIYSGQETWTISPVAYGAGYAGVFTNEGGQVGSKGVYEPHAIRPVVTLKAGMNFISGTGEKTNPYIVE